MLVLLETTLKNLFSSLRCVAYFVFVTHIILASEATMLTIKS